MNRFTAVAVPILLVAVSAAQAEPLCDPADDPCVVDRPILVSADEAGELNLGLRALQIVGRGRLLLPDGGILRCGGLLVATGREVAIDARQKRPEGTFGASVWVDVQRTCSDASATACTSDLQCTAGTCTIGDGAVLFEGGYRSDGDIGGSLRIRAAGPATLAGVFNVSSTSSSGIGRDLIVETGLEIFSSQAPSARTTEIPRPRAASTCRPPPICT